MKIKEALGKALIIAFVSAGLCSCIETPLTEGVDTSLTASFADDSTILWKGGDLINIFNGNGKGKYTAAIVGSAGEAKFFGSFIGDFAPSAGNPLLGLYPYSEDASSDGNSITTTISTAQSPGKGTFAAKADSAAIIFHKITGEIAFTLKNDDINEIVFKSQGGESIAGKAKISFKDDVPFIESIIDGKDAITLTPKEGKSFKAGELYSISVLPGVLKYGLEVTLYTADKYAAKKMGNSMEVSLKTPLEFKELDHILAPGCYDETIFIERGKKPWESSELSYVQRLMSLPDVVSVKEDINFDLEYGSFKIAMFRLPIDHNDPSKGYFLNEVNIGIKDPDSLNVIYFTGYSNFQTFNPRDAIAELVDGNQFKIEHRDFGSSSTGTDYACLTTAQAAADQRQIIENLKLMFPRRFAVTGVSKGGITAALLAGYYPELDMVYVPVSAPFCRMRDDTKGHIFLLEQFRTEEIRKRMDELQRKMLRLMDNTRVMDEFARTFEARAYKPEMSVKDAFYYAVQEYLPGFWQSNSNENVLPDPSLEGLQLWNAVKDDLTSGIGNDSFVYNIQSARELGSFGFTDNLSDIYSPECKEYCRAQLPARCRDDKYSSQTYERYIDEAVAKTDRPMLFLYGEYDHWRAWAIDDKYVNGVNVRKYTIPGQYHNIDIQSFEDESTRKEVEDWILHYMYR